MGANWFIALPIPAAEWFGRLPAPPAQVRLFPRDDLHLTVAFLGPVSAESAQAAFAQASGWPRGALEVQLGRVLPMGRPRRYSALSAELVLGRAPVERAITLVRDAMCDAAGVRRDERPARAHVTLARPSRRASDAQRSAGLAWAEGLALDAPPMLLERIALYTWAHDRTERLFRIVESQAFSEPRDHC
jgi:2'-5' RNA ligase